MTFVLRHFCSSNSKGEEIFSAGVFRFSLMERRRPRASKGAFKFSAGVFRFSEVERRRPRASARVRLERVLSRY